MTRDRKSFGFFLSCNMLSAALLFLASSARAEESFEQWRKEFRQQAMEAGISPQLADQALNDITPDETVITLDRKQPENKITLEKYLKNTVTPRRIRQGKALLVEYGPVLDRIGRDYGVPPNYLVALWGIESDYGAFQGNFSVVQSLATLAYEGRRREFFGKELIAALRILEAEQMAPYELTGSWAGAMGDCQFMPSTYLKYAVDANRDGHRDIWNTPTDSLASIANYLHDLGWNAHYGWGSKAFFTQPLATRDGDLTQGKSSNVWAQEGIQGDKLGPIATAPLLYAIYVGAETAPYLVTDNYKALLQWNRSRYFATAVGQLADALEE